MTSNRRSICVVAVAIFGLGTAAWADQPARPGPLVGEIRAMAVAAPATRGIAQLHEQGWIEARGELVSAKEFPELFNTIGRAWTSDGVPEDRFAVPEIEAPRGIRSANPFGVMGPGDYVAGGRETKPWLNHAPISFWIYAGRRPVRH